VNGISGLNAAMPEELPFDAALEGLSVCVQIGLFSGGSFLKPSPAGGKMKRAPPPPSTEEGRKGMELAADVKSEDWDTGALHTQSLPFANGGFDQVCLPSNIHHPSTFMNPQHS
jgi:hypothetical protein